jgi:hypothetical protein
MVWFSFVSLMDRIEIDGIQALMVDTELRWTGDRLDKARPPVDIAEMRA